MIKLPNKQELNKKIKKELIAIARKMKIKGIYSLRKAELIDTMITRAKRQGNSITTEIQENTSTSKATSSMGIKPKEEDKKIAKETHNFPIPSEYGDTTIKLLVKDPDFIFAYWEINNAVVETNKLENKKLLLRIYDVSDISFNGQNANYFFDIPVSLENNNWYIKVPESNREYCVDLGYLDEKGNFRLIARSNVANVPRSSISENYDEEWMAVEELFRLSGGYKGQAQLSGSMEIEKMLTERLKMSISSEAFITSWPLSSSDIIK